MNKIKMQKQILESEGSKCIGKMRYHNITIEILKKNYLELTKSLNYFERFENSLKLMVQSNREEADKYHNEVTRLLHNFLASTKTLIDHTRIFFEKNYSRDEVFKHYKEKIEIEFKNDELSRFIQDLRNYILHRGLPYTGMLLKANLETTVYLDRDLMLEWSKWTAPSRNYLLAQDKNIRILDFIESYVKKVDVFNTWAKNTLRNYHEKDLEELRLLQNQYRNYFGEES